MEVCEEYLRSRGINLEFDEGVSRVSVLNIGPRQTIQMPRGRISFA